MEYQIMTQFRATRLRAEASRRASRCLVPLASPLAGQSSLGVFKHSANSRATPLKQGLFWPPLALSAKYPRRLGRKLASGDTCSRDAPARQPEEASRGRPTLRRPRLKQ